MQDIADDDGIVTVLAVLRRHMQHPAVAAAAAGARILYTVKFCCRIIISTVHLLVSRVLAGGLLLRRACLSRCVCRRCWALAE